MLADEAYKILIMHLLADELEESKTTGQKLLEEGRNLIYQPFLEHVPTNLTVAVCKVAYMVNMLVKKLLN